MKHFLSIFLIALVVISACKSNSSKKELPKENLTATIHDTTQKSYQPGQDAFKPGTSDTDENSQWTFTKAATLIGLGNYDEALNYMNQYIEKNPEDGNGFFVRGFIYEQKKEYEKAIEEFDEALRLNAAHTYAYMYKGEAHIYLKQFKEAYVCFTKVIQIEPKNMYAYYNRGIALSNMNKYKEAIADFDVALHIDSTYSPALNNRGNAKFMSGDPDGACKDWKKSIRLGNIASEKAYNHYCLKNKIR
ncbi:MAG TPA: tetratricopeptide repeat protein [Bacteroidales bacterium]|nr:tetratricopeptide repeat protein [Bacteroidales bacterium]MDI9573635.1 tetratricopeptide repeat protein [Bacteroidota bacterium]NMD15806.1 tetratricopeptide repeat protein [Bacteroidales bacterium]HOE58174.1 tetratricopeptide repeat protein [Bacteroidales bacterium]HOR03920.1 tetratricopeptide repeat protein [Bacteroidales bacterium]